MNYVYCTHTFPPRPMPASSRFTTALGFFACGLVLGVTTITIGAGSRGSDRFSDVPAGSYYDDAVGEMAELGVIRGQANGRFGPGAYVTRAELAVMLKRLRDDILGVTPSTSNTSSSSRSSRSSSSITSSASAASSSSSSRSVASKNPAGSIRFTINRFTATEGKSPMSITLVRTGGAAGVASVMYALKDGSAKAGKDYVIASGKITFASGETTRTVTVDIMNNSDADGVREFSIEISGPEGGAGIGVPASATIAIADDDAASSAAVGDNAAIATVFRFSALLFSVAENGASATVTVERTGGSTAAASVQYATGDGTAKSLSDYKAANGTLQFAAGETEKSFTVTVNDDGSTEGNEKILLKLLTPTGGPTIDANRGTSELMIVDNEVIAYGTGSLRFTKEKEEVLESAKELILVVERIGGARGAIAVDYASANGLAKAGEDFEKVEGVLLFRDGEMKKTIAVKIIKDAKEDPNETFTVSLSNPTRGAVLGTPKTVVVTIIE